MLSPIQLLEHKLVEISVKPAEGLTKEQVEARTMTVTHKLAWGQNPQDPKLWAVRLRVELIPGEESNPSLYRGAAEMMGQFLLQPGTESDNVRDMVVMNGAAMLYTCIREWVANITARSLHGMVELPTGNPAMFRPPAAAVDGKDDATKG